MTAKRRFVHTVFLFLLPLVVAWFGWSVFTAGLLVVLMLLWRWAIALSTFLAPERVPPVVLETISGSHFVEKVRWNMDIAGIDYVERPAAGTLGAFFAGRTVPRLQMTTGAVRSQIGNSAEILRYLWGAYAADPDVNVAHLEPTSERLELERQLDRYGVNLQIWVYHHVLEDKELTLQAWGVNDAAVPVWQRLILRVLFPLQAAFIRRSFRITPERYERACEHMENLFADIDTRLADGRRSILGGERCNYTDYAFAGMTGLWLQPAGYGGGKADNVRIERSRTTAPMRADIERWSEDYPRAVSWVQMLYAEERMSGESETSTENDGQ